MIDRRSFVGSTTASLLALPIGLFAQSLEKTWRIGFLSPGAPSSRDVPDLFGRGALLQA